MLEVIRTYEDLVRLIKNNYIKPDLSLVERAYKIANDAHHGELRFSGHPFITHPLAVAYKLAEMGFPMNMVVAGLLHDVVEDTEVGLEKIKSEFGDDVAGLVEGVTKLKKLNIKEHEVFCLLAKGLSDEKVATALNVSRKTITNYKNTIKEKLQVSSVTEMTIIASKVGLLKLSDLTDA